MKLFMIVSSNTGRRDVHTSMLATDDAAAIARINRKFPETEGWTHIAEERDTVILACSDDSGA